MKLTLLSIFAITALLVSGCTQETKPVICGVEKVVVDVVSSNITTLLSCKNPEVIKSDLTEALNKSQFCSQPSMSVAQKVQTKGTDKLSTESVKVGPVGSIVCPLAINAVFGLAGSQIPSTWGCDPSKTISSIATTLIAVCTAAVPI